MLQVKISILGQACSQSVTICAVILCIIHIQSYMYTVICVSYILIYISVLVIKQRQGSVHAWHKHFWRLLRRPVLEVLLNPFADTAIGLSPFWSAVLRPVPHHVLEHIPAVGKTEPSHNEVVEILVPKSRCCSVCSGQMCSVVWYSLTRKYIQCEAQLAAHYYRCDQ